MSPVVTDPTFNPSGNDAVDTIKSGFVKMEQVIMVNCPEGRRRSIALTKLEEAAMFAVKSVSEA